MDLRQLIEAQTMVEVADSLAENLAGLLTAVGDWPDFTLVAGDRLADHLAGCRAALDYYYEAKGGDEGDLS